MTATMNAKPQSKASDEQQIKQEALTVIERAQIVKIVDQDSYDSACSLLLEQVKPFRKKWKEYWDAVKRPLKEAVDAVQQKFNEADKPLETAELNIKSAIRQWDEEQERIRQELQRQAELEARKREEEERLKTVEQLKDDDPFVTEEDVQAILTAPSIAIARPVEATYSRAVGVSKRDNWKCRVTDIKALCRAVANGKVPPTYVVANESVLNARAKADRQTLNIPGCVPYNDPVIAGRSR